MKTLKAWQESDTNSFDQFVPKYSEVDEEVYWHFLEILPPFYCPSGFMVSEPYSYCSEYDTETYACFVQLGSRYYYLGNISPKAVRSEIANLKERLSPVVEIKGQDVKDHSDDVLCFLESADESVLIHYGQLYGCMDGIHSIHAAIENAEGFKSFYEREVNF